MLVDNYICSICFGAPASRMCDFILPGGDTKKMPLCREDGCVSVFYVVMRATIETAKPVSTTDRS